MAKNAPRWSALVAVGVVFVGSGCQGVDGSSVSVTGGESTADLTATSAAEATIAPPPPQDEIAVFPAEIASAISEIAGDRFVDASSQYADPDSGVVALEQVRQIAEAEFRLSQIAPGGAAFYLVEWLPGEEGMRNLDPGQLIWLVDVLGYESAGEGVAGGPPPPVLRHKYIYIDASTGTPLGSLETE